MPRPLICVRVDPDTARRVDRLVSAIGLSGRRGGRSRVVRRMLAAAAAIAEAEGLSRLDELAAVTGRKES